MDAPDKRLAEIRRLYEGGYYNPLSEHSLAIGYLLQQVESLTDALASERENILDAEAKIRELDRRERRCA